MHVQVCSCKEITQHGHLATLTWITSLPPQWTYLFAKFINKSLPTESLREKLAQRGQKQTGLAFRSSFIKKQLQEFPCNSSNIWIYVFFHWSLVERCTAAVIQKSTKNSMCLLNTFASHSCCLRALSLRRVRVWNSALWSWHRMLCGYHGRCGFVAGEDSC